jgi:ABC-type transporter Mla subunit MlaD
MKQETKSDYVIAGIVVACSIVMLGALTIALTGFRWPSLGRSIEMDFQSVAGVRVSSQVRYAGVKVGTISRIEFLTPEQRKKRPDYVVRVTADLDGNAPILYRGTKAEIVSDTILAEKFVDLIPPPADQLNPEKLSRFDVIDGQRVVGFDELTRTGYDVVKNVSEVLNKLREDYPDLHVKIGSLIESSEHMMKNADALSQRLDELIASNDPSIRSMVSDLRVTSQNLKVTSAYAKVFAHTVGEKPWRVIWGGDPSKLPSEEEILKSKEPIPIASPTSTPSTERQKGDKLKRR